MSDNRVVLINRTISSLSNTSAVSGIHKGEWCLVQDINTIYWKNPITNTLEPISKTGKPEIINKSINSLTESEAIKKITKGEWVFVQTEKTMYWRNPVTDIFEPMLNLVDTSSKELESSTLIELDLSKHSYFYTKPLIKNVTMSPLNYPTEKDAVVSFILEITNGGAHTVTWWNHLTWEFGSPPELAVNGTTVLGFYGLRKQVLDSYIWRGIVLSQETLEPVSYVS